MTIYKKFTNFAQPKKRSGSKLPDAFGLLSDFERLTTFYQIVL